MNVTEIDQRPETGPFDIIGDVHGCADELDDLLKMLGYEVALRGSSGQEVAIQTPPGRRAVFVGDLVDRGPRSPDVLRIVMAMVRAGQALCVIGNHDHKFARWLAGRDVKISHGLQETVAQMAAETSTFHQQAAVFLDALPSHLWLDGGALVIAHAGIREDYIGQDTGKVRSFCLYGDTTGERDEYGLPVRFNWAADYCGPAAIVYGHTPVPSLKWLNNTICIDTGCVFGGALSALRWPERELLQLPARRAYAQLVKPLAHPPARLPAQN